MSGRSGIALPKVNDADQQCILSGPKLGEASRGCGEYVAPPDSSLDSRDSGVFVLQRLLLQLSWPVLPAVLPGP